MNIWDEKFYGGKEHLKDVFRIPHEDFDQFVKLLKERKAKRILDLGCGTGRHTMALAKLGFDVYGIDISKNALAVCRKRLAEDHLRAEVILGDMYQTLPYQDNFFDGLISTNALHHALVKDIKKLIGEIERILKPGAVIMVEFPRQVGKIRDKEIEPGTVVPIEGSEKGIPHHLSKDENELKELFKNFEIIKILKKEKKNKSKTSYHFMMFGKLNK